MMRFYAFLTSILLLQACGNKDLHDYYFPIKQLKEQPKVYEYMFATQDTSLTIYWYYHTETKGDSVFLVGNLYDGGFHPIMQMQEEKVFNGMKLKELIYYGLNKEGHEVQTAATIEGGAVFPFEVKDDKSVFVNVLKYADFKDSLKTTTLTRNRRFLKSTTFDYQGKKHDAIEFEMKEEQVEHDLKQGGWTHIYNVQEIYAKGIGLVYTKRALDSGMSFETKLVDVYTPEVLEAKLSKQLNRAKEGNKPHQ